MYEKYISVPKFFATIMYMYNLSSLDLLCHLCWQNKEIEQLICNLWTAQLYIYIGNECPKNADKDLMDCLQKQEGLSLCPELQIRKYAHLPKSGRTRWIVYLAC